MISCFVFLSTFCHSKYVVLGKAQPYQGLLQCYSSVLGRNQHSQKLPEYWRFCTLFHPVLGTRRHLTRGRANREEAAGPEPPNCEVTEQQSSAGMSPSYHGHAQALRLLVREKDYLILKQEL